MKCFFYFRKFVKSLYQTQKTLACTQTACALCTLCGISLMVAFNSVQTDLFLVCLVYFCPDIFLLVDMNSIIKSPQSECLNWLGTSIYLLECLLRIFYFPSLLFIFLHFSVVTVLIRPFSVISVLLHSPPLPLFLCLCFLSPPHPFLHPPPHSRHL